MNFVNNLTALPTGTRFANDVNTSKATTANDWNTAMQACYDLRKAILELRAQLTGGGYGSSSLGVFWGPVGSSPNASGASAAGDMLTLQPADSNFPGIVTTSSQTFSGDKTFLGNIYAANLTGTIVGSNTGDVTLTDVGSTPSLQGASLFGQALTLQPADATNPGLVTTQNQTFSGDKTFLGNIYAANLTGSSSGINTGDVTLGVVGNSPAPEGATLVGQLLALQPADATNPGLITALNQTIAGDKTFLGNISALNISGINTGDVVLAPLGIVPTAEGATLVGQTLTLYPADSTYPGLLTPTDWTTFNNKFTLPGLVYGGVVLSDGVTITQDPTFFYWDTVNHRLGIGNVAPSVELHVTGSARVTSLSSAQFVKSDTNGLLSNALVDLTTDVTGILPIANGGTGTNIDVPRWKLAGNALTNPATDFIGTTDLQPLVIATDGLQRAYIDESGRFGIGPDVPLAQFHLKPYAAYAGTGVRMDTFVLTTSNAIFNPLVGFNMENNSILRITIEVMARQSDGLGRAAFTRTALFYKEGGNVLIQGPSWQSDFTAISDPGFEFNFTLGVSSILFSVKSASSVQTFWSGNTKIEILKTSI